MSVPHHDLAEVRALLLEQGYDVPALVLRSWNQREVHQAYSWASFRKRPWGHGLRFAHPPWMLERFDIRCPQQQKRASQ